jgi:lipopolysaccharide export system ATP-binding protein
MKHRLPKPKAPKKTDRILVDDYSGADIDNGAAVTASGPLPKEAAKPEVKTTAKTDDTIPPKAGDPFSGNTQIVTEERPPEATAKKQAETSSASPPPGAETIASPGHPQPNQPFLIQTRGLVKQYGGRRVVNGVDIHVRPGEVVGLLGKNGAGKTTTFYMIVGLVTPTEGQVYMGDEDVTLMPMYRRARRGIGYLPQEESIFRKLNVEDNLLAILETLPMTEEERDTRCDELLRDFGLEHVRENIAITLSGGEKRRVTIARALVTSPQLLLLDEPFSGVDPMAVHDIQEIILSLKKKGLGVLITDHNVRETLSVVDRAYIIDEGRVLSEGTREFLLNDPIAREIYLGHRFSM